MKCERCESILGTGEGLFIVYNNKEICVCQKCHEEIRQINILKFGKGGK